MKLYWTAVIVFISLVLQAQCEWMRSDLSPTTLKSHRFSYVGDGNVYVQLDTLLMKYTSAGTIIWTKTIVKGLQVQSISSATNGAIYVAGVFSGNVNYQNYTFSSNGGNDLFVLKFSSAGQLEWKYNCGGKKSLNCGGISADFPGNAVVTGSFTDTMLANSQTIAATHSISNVYVLKLTSTGAVSWCKKSSAGFGTGRFIKTDSLSNIYVVTEISRDTLVFGGLKARGSDMGETDALLFMDSTGNPKSLKYFYTTLYGNLKGYGTDRLRSLTIISEERYDNYIAVYDASGKQIDGARAFASSYLSGFESVHVTPLSIYALGWFTSGNICDQTFVGGRRVLLKFPRNSNTCPSYQVIEKYSPSGSMIGGTDDELYFTGFFTDTLRVFNCNLVRPTSNYHPVLVKLSGTLVNLSESGSEPTLKIFPNPVSRVLYINGLDQGMSITVVNVLGKKILEKEKLSEPETEVDVGSWSEGVYIITMTSKAGISKTSKIIVE